MKKAVLITILIGIFVTGQSSLEGDTQKKDIRFSTIDDVIQDEVIVGAERFASYLPMLYKKNVALVVNQTSVVGSTHLVDTLQSLGINIVKVFAPEHGFRGDHSAGETISSGVDQKTELPVVSLYGKNKKPNKEMLADVDVVIFDIQDVGVRFYTYISTMHYVMEACGEQRKSLIILDRPNPNGFYIGGPVLKKEYSSFIGMHQIPIVHGLTVGELAHMIKGEGWLKNNVECDLTVILCLNYDHQKLYQLPIPPSPNLPNMNSVYLYPYLGLFEGTNVSIGRGTELPFQIIGRPNGNGQYSFTPKSIPGVSDNPKYKNQECFGEVVKDVSDSSLFINPHLNLAYLIKYYKSNDAINGPYFKNFIYKLMGYKEFTEQVSSGMTERQIQATWQADLTNYMDTRKKYLLYQ